MSSTTPGSEPERTRDDVEREPAVEPTAGPGDGVAASTAGEHDETLASDRADGIDAVDSDERNRPDATARLDEAVGRANAAPASSDAEASRSDDGPQPAPADGPRRESYIPSATVAGSAGDGGATTRTPEPRPEAAPPASAPQTIYVQAPTPPKRRGNRGFGVLVALIGTLVFALLYAGVAYLLIWFYGAGRGEGIGVYTEFLTRAVFWLPVLAFFLGFALLAALVNRGAWWYYAVFGLLVGVLVYFSYIGGSLLTVQAWTLTVEEGTQFLGQRWLDPFAIAAAVIAREVPIWLGGWIAARGRTVTERNRLASEAYERELASGPQPQRY